MVFLKLVMFDYNLLFFISPLIGLYQSYYDFVIKILFEILIFPFDFSIYYTIIFSLIYIIFLIYKSASLRYWLLFLIFNLYIYSFLFVWMLIIGIVFFLLLLVLTPKLHFLFKFFF